jgi:N-methylhydantoinase A/oxoprolinase/acetone carboxylase beta subunit
MVDIHTVGAGGGSIGWRDAGGALRVGPRSAGAVPGPAAYGRGGTEPTVTDAHVVLGAFDTARPLAGGVRIDPEAAHAAVARLAAQLGLDVRACAEGIVRVANAEMVRALRVMSVERGLDPRDFALLAFGGAGGLHAVAIAEELGMRRILLPRASGVLSALGLAAAGRRVNRQRSVLLSGAGLHDAALDAARRQLDDEARTLLGADGGRPIESEVAFDVRYRGQSHELTVRGPELTAASALREAFEDEHERRYGWREAHAEVEVVTVRVAALDPGPAVALAAADRPAPETVRGPTVLHLPETTVVVPPGWSGRHDATGTLVLERAA